MGLLDGLLDIGGQIVGGWFNSSAQHKANRTNIYLQRQQQAWEEEMSNTAVQRRARDIEAAGGNRALAFVNGQEASTPTVTPAHVEPTKIDPLRLGSSMLLAQQVKAMEANTRKTNAEAQIIETEIPWASANARARADMAQEQLRKIGSEIANLNLLNTLNQVNWDIAELDLKQKEKIYPLQQLAQELVNEQTRTNIAGQNIENLLKGENITTAQTIQLKNKWEAYLLQLGSEEAKQAAAFWKNAPAGKFLMFMRQLLR